MQYLRRDAFRIAESHAPVPRDALNQLLDKGLIEIRMARDLSDGSPRYWKIRRNGKTQTWKRDANRVRIPFKYGMYGYGAITEADFVE